jgi:hypothetical protein
MEIHPIIIVIVLMSFIGISINLTNDNIKEAKEIIENDPKKLNLKSENIIDKYITKESPQSLNINDNSSIPLRFDTMGNKLGLTGNGLTAGKQIINAKAKGGGVPTVNLGEQAGATALKVNNANYGDKGNIAFKNPGLPFNVYATFEQGALRPMSAKEIRNNVGQLRNTKFSGLTGQIYKPNKDSVILGEAYEPLILKKEILNLNKRLRSNKNDDIYLHNVDRSKIQERNNFNISRVESDVYEIYEKPNPNDITNDRNVERAKDLNDILHRQNYMELLRKTGKNDVATQLKHKM